MEKKKKDFFRKIINIFKNLFKKKKKEKKQVKKREETVKPRQKKEFPKKPQIQIDKGLDIIKNILKKRKIFKTEPKKTKEVPKLSTQIDELLNVISLKGVSIYNLSKRLKQKPEKIEEWGKLLQEQGLVELVYPENPFKKPYIKRVYAKR